MFLFCMTTMVCTVSLAASVKGSRPSGAIISSEFLFLMANRSTFKYAPD